MFLKIFYLSLVFLHLNIYLTRGDNLCPKGCLCKDLELHCMCNNGDTIVLEPPMNIEPKEISVRGCAVLAIYSRTFLQMKLDFIELIDIEFLYLDSHSLVTNHSMNYLLLENISALHAELFGLSGLKDINQIIIKNVCIDKLPELSFRVSNISVLHIENCLFQALESLSFSAVNISTLSITRSQFNRMRSEAFFVREVDEFFLEDSSFAEIDKNSLSNIDSGLFIIKNCIFKTLKKKALRLNVEDFVFDKNVVRNVRKYAFQNINVKHVLRFTNNLFHKIEERSLLPVNSMKTENMHIYGNKFSCDCQILWLLHSPEQNFRFIISSTCSNYGNTSLKETMKLISKGSCSSGAKRKKAHRKKSKHSREQDPDELMHIVNLEQRMNM